MTTATCTLLIIIAIISSASPQPQQGLQNNDKDSTPPASEFQSLPSRPASGLGLSYHEDDAIRERNVGKRSSLGMFPRVGRNPNVKSRVERAAGLHVFPRIGRSSSQFYEQSNMFPRLLRNLGLGTFPRIGRGGLAMFPRVGRGGLAAFPRLGRGPSSLGVFPRVGRDQGMQRDERALAKFPRIGRSGEDVILTDKDVLTYQEASPGYNNNEKQISKRLEGAVRSHQPYFFPSSMMYPRLEADDEEEDESWFDEPLPVIAASETQQGQQASKRAADQNDDDSFWFGPRLGRKRRDVRSANKHANTGLRQQAEIIA